MMLARDREAAVGNTWHRPGMEEGRKETQGGREAWIPGTKGKEAPFHITLWDVVPCTLRCV